MPSLRISVSTSPGAMALTLTLSGPKSAAISLVSAANAAFEVAYAGPANGCTLLPAIEVIFTIAPFADANSFCKPLANTTEAKKFT